MNFKKWVKSIETAGYNGARMVAVIRLAWSKTALLYGMYLSTNMAVIFKYSIPYYSKEYKFICTFIIR